MNRNKVLQLALIVWPFLFTSVSRFSPSLLAPDLTFEYNTGTPARKLGPVPGRRPVPCKAEGDCSPKGGAPMKVLIVDDNPTAIKMLELAFTRAGYEVDVAGDGVEALAKIPLVRPDMVIMDIMMPNMDGFEATRQLRANPATANIPIIVLTARDRIEDKLSGFESGADDYVVKPVLPSELVARVNALLRRSQQAAARAPEQRGRTFGFLGVKGGVGTTTLAVNVAVALAQSKKRVILADLHPWAGTAAMQLGLVPRGNVSQLAQSEASGWSTALLESSLERHRSGVLVFGVPMRTQSYVGALEPEKLVALVDGFETMADVVIVDMGNGLTPTALALGGRCHSAFLVLESDGVVIQLTVETVKRLEQVGLIGSRLGLVMVNRARSTSSYTRDEIEQQLGSKLTAVIAPEPEACFHAAKTGTPVVLGQADTILAAQLRELSSGLL
jgi:DNA-binding response OmpR family regulator